MEARERAAQSKEARVAAYAASLGGRENELVCVRFEMDEQAVELSTLPARLVVLEEREQKLAQRELLAGAVEAQLAVATAKLLHASPPDTGVERAAAGGDGEGGRIRQASEGPAVAKAG